MEELFERLSKSDFRSRFKLKKTDIEYIRKKGMPAIESHARDFVAKRLSPAEIPNDGKQTPMRGHPVFIAQHATACCCRGCLKKWYGYEFGKELTLEQQDHIVDVLMEWINRQLRAKGISLTDPPASEEEPKKEEYEQMTFDFL